MDIVRIGGLELGAGRPLIIVPLTASPLSALLEEASALSALPADMAEWRIDMFFGTSEPEEAAVLKVLSSLRRVLKKPLLATFRTMDEGGQCPISAEGYASLCAAVCKSGMADMIDVEAFFHSGKAKDIISFAHDSGVPVVASNHDFHATPPKDEMVRRLLFMQDELGADVLKIAVMPRCRSDVLALLAATEEAYSRVSKPVISMSMGALGSISRVCGHVFGSAATFASARSASAPGQMDVRRLSSILRKLDGAE